MAFSHHVPGLVVDMVGHSEHSNHFGHPLLSGLRSPLPSHQETERMREELAIMDGPKKLPYTSLGYTATQTHPLPPADCATIARDWHQWVEDINGYYVIKPATLDYEGNWVPEVRPGLVYKLKQKIIQHDRSVRDVIHTHQVPPLWSKWTGIFSKYTYNASCGCQACFPKT